MEQLAGAEPVRLMLHRVSWLLLARGIACAAACAFAIAAGSFPALVRVASVYAIVDGVLAVALGRARPAAGDDASSPLWPMVFSGLASLAGGTLAWIATGASHGFTLLATGLLTRGVFEVLAAILLREAGYNERLLGIAGLSTLLVAAVALTWDLDAFAWQLLLAAHLGVSGGTMVALSVRVRLPGVAVPGAVSRPPTIPRAWRRLRGGAGPPAALR